MRRGDNWAGYERPSNAVRHILIGWGDEHGVTCHCLSLLTTPTKHNEHPPQPLTIGHKHPPPGSTVDDKGPLTSTKPTTRIDEQLRGPITTIDEGPPPGPINGYNHPQPQLMNGHKGPLAPPSTNGHRHPRRSMNGKSLGNPHPNADASPNAKVNQTRTPARTRVPPTTSIFMKRATARAPQFAISAGS